MPPRILPTPPNPRRQALEQARRLLLDRDSEALETSTDRPPRLTPDAILGSRMSRSRDRILANLDDMYREAFERSRAAEDQGQMTALDFAYRREQLYLEILLDIRDSLERR